MFPLIIIVIINDLNDQTGHTALQRAAAEGHVEIVKQLVKQGASVDHQDEVVSGLGDDDTNGDDDDDLDADDDDENKNDGNNDVQKEK